MRNFLIGVAAIAVVAIVRNQISNRKEKRTRTDGFGDIDGRTVEYTIL